ncbi:MAG: hydroxymethylglutaryl-CoA lyase [Leptospiraceae bacterium]|nr:hydroxymethylglutaryl-CoA lyase [Leptospiraceae bacterium]
MPEKESIKITEVGPRDGLQNEYKPVSTSDKFEFIRLLGLSGIQCIEATSFVKPGAIPQLSDASVLSEKLNFQSGITYSALAPNKKGYETAIQFGYREIAIFTAASNSFTKKNINKTIQESIEIFLDISKQAVLDKIKVRAYISTVVACPYEGIISPSSVLEVAKQLLDQGVYEISLGETIGVAVPNQVEDLLTTLFGKFSPSLFAGHFHDTYGMATANAAKSLEMGIRSFDSSAGGLGGCPYAPGAAGNVATEDLVYFLENSGYSTGIDLNKVMDASAFISQKIERNLISKTYLALQSRCESVALS